MISSKGGEVVHPTVECIGISFLLDKRLLTLSLYHLLDAKHVLGSLLYLWLVEGYFDGLTIQIFDFIGHRIGILYVDILENFFGPVCCVSLF